MLALNDAAHNAEQYSAYVEWHLDQRRQRIEQLDAFVRHRLRLYRQAQANVQQKKTNKTIETVTLPPPIVPGETVTVLSQRNSALRQDPFVPHHPAETTSRVRESKHRLASKQLAPMEHNTHVDDAQPLGTWLHPAPQPIIKVEPDEEISLISGTTMRRSMSETRLSSFAMKALTASISGDLNHIENRKRLQATRNLFMTIERRQIREATMLNKKNKEMQRLIELKEAERLHQEEALAQRQVTVSSALNQATIDVNSTDPKQLALLHQQRNKDQKQRELERYIRALKTNIKERCIKRGITVPSLCSCHSSIWDADPMNCSQNCSFYRNPAAFATSLHSLLTSCQATN